MPGFNLLPKIVVIGTLPDNAVKDFTFPFSYSCNSFVSWSIPIFN